MYSSLMKPVHKRTCHRDQADHRVVSDGVELLQAQFERHVFERHIHDSYAIGFTLRGIQRFWCRGSTHNSTRGHVIAISPGEAHDGESGAAGGYAYRMFYVSIERVRQILDDAHERRLAQFDACTPLIRDPVLASRFNLTWRAVSHCATSLAADELLGSTLGLLAERHGGLRIRRDSMTDQRAVMRIRDYLHAGVGERIRVDDLAALASMSRFQLSRQFQKAFGLPLHAYHLHVRLGEARRRLTRGEPIASVAHDLGFVDQSHLHRRFKGAFGFTPGEWRQAAQRSKTSAHRTG